MKKITIKDIAELSGTSKTTVSFYLNGKKDKMSKETRERIEAAIKETNYQPNIVARSLNAKSMKLIGVIIGDITNSFANQIVKGIDQIAKDKKYKLLVANSAYDYETEKEYVENMLAMQVDGLIVQPTVEFEKIQEKLIGNKIPVVYIDSQLRNTKGYWVKTNNFEAVMDATEQIIELGYEDFIIIAADPSVLTTRLERYSGFQEGLKMHNKEAKHFMLEPDTSTEEIEEFLENNIDLNRRTAIFAANCWGLPKVFLALKKWKKYIPNQVGLIGFDNTEWTEFSSPTVSTIVQPAFQEGKQATKILIDAIEGHHEEAPNQILKCTLSLNESIK